MQVVALTLLTLLLLGQALRPLVAQRRASETVKDGRQAPRSDRSDHGFAAWDGVAAPSSLDQGAAACIGCALAVAAPGWARTLGGDAGSELLLYGLICGTLVSLLRWRHDLVTFRATNVRRASASAPPDPSSTGSNPAPTVHGETRSETPADHKLNAALRQPMVRAAKVLTALLVVTLSIHFFAPALSVALGIDRASATTARAATIVLNPGAGASQGAADGAARASLFAWGVCVLVALVLWSLARRRPSAPERAPALAAKLPLLASLRARDLSWAIPAIAFACWTTVHLDRIFSGAPFHIMSHGVLESRAAALVLGLLLGLTVGSTYALLRSTGGATLVSTRGQFHGLASLLVILAPLIVAISVQAMEIGALAMTHRGAVETLEGNPRWLLLENAQRRALMPEPRTGQRIILPHDTAFEAGKTYSVRFHADPRGVKVGTLLAAKNVLLVPAWQVASAVDHLWFRAREAEMALIPGFDFEVPVTSRPLFAQDDDRPTAFELSPVDSEIDLAKLARRFDGPYTPLGDLEITGSVLDAYHGTFGPHRFMYESRPPKAAQDPVLREVVGGLRYAGPFPIEADEELLELAPTRAARVPLALAALADTNLADGDVVRLTMEPPLRGVTIGELRAIQGELRVPAWDVFAATKVGILRHRSDPSLDVRFPVEHRLAADGTLRFRSAIPEVIALEHFDAMTDYESVGLISPPVVFWAFVQRTARGQVNGEPRLVLIPDLGLIEPVRALGGGIYAPHPIELTEAGFATPRRDLSGAGLYAEILLGSVRSRESLALPILVSRVAAGVLALLITMALIDILARCGAALLQDMNAVRDRSVRDDSTPLLAPLELVIIAAGLGWTTLLVFAADAAMPADPRSLGRAFILLAVLALVASLARQWLLGDARRR